MKEVWEVVSSLKETYTYKLRTPLPRGSSLCEGMREEYCTQPYPCICKEAVSGFEPMTNKSPRHNFTTAPGLTLKETYTYARKKNLGGKIHKIVIVGW
ncbi:hypothetical protein HKD37_03G007222 [Glycine soja]